MLRTWRRCSPSRPSKRYQCAGIAFAFATLAGGCCEDLGLEGHAGPGQVDDEFGAYFRGAFNSHYGIPLLVAGEIGQDVPHGALSALISTFVSIVRLGMTSSFGLAFCHRGGV